MKTIAVTNAKGGSGKTTTAVNLAAALPGKVLLLDLDQQASATICLGMEPGEASAYDVLAGRATIAEAAISRTKKLDVLPADIRLAKMPAKPRLAQALEAVGYDWCIIDCPPSITGTTQEALRVSDYIVVPVRADYLSMLGIEAIEEAARMVNPSLKVAAYVVTDLDKRKAICTQVAKTLTGKYGKGRVFTVGTCVALEECPIEGQTIYEYAPKSRAAQDYKALAKAIAKELR